LPQRQSVEPENFGGKPQPYAPIHWYTLEVQIKRLFVFVACMIAYTSLCLAEGKADYSTKTPDSYKKEIREVMEAFRASIIAKNREALTRLSFSGSIPRYQ
jgi:hypothetical protein